MKQIVLLLFESRELTDMNNMTFIVEEDVAIVPIFDLHEKTYYGVRLSNNFRQEKW